MTGKWETIVVAGVLFIAGLLPSPCRGAATSQPARAPVVVELFTSEGCSSCPPAEDALAEIVKRSADHGEAVYALAFHVDYWDSLGWRDSFDDPSYSDRQRQYARLFKLDSIYTPQLIVNGATQFVGSDREKTRQAIDHAQSGAALTPLLAELTADGDERVVDIRHGSLAVGTIINVAVVERGLVSRITRGENSGRTLRHENVVRWFHHDLCQDSDHLRVRLPKLPLVQIANASVVVYAQQPVTWHVVAATEVALSLKPLPPAK